MKQSKRYLAKIKKTGETVTLYKLENGNWYDFNNMGAHEPPTSTTGRKEFAADEIELLKPIEQ